MDVQVEGAGVGAASAVVVDTAAKNAGVGSVIASLPMPAAITRAIAVGGLTAGGMYLWKGDMLWMVWLPAAAASYLASDWATKSMM